MDVIPRLSLAALDELRRREATRWQYCPPTCKICEADPAIWVVSMRLYDAIRLDIDTVRPGSWEIDDISFNLRLFGIPVVATNNEPKVARLTGGWWLT